ncbi:hypothetical protein D3C83_84870 [compost metagenome]
MRVTFTWPLPTRKKLVPLSFSFTMTFLAGHSNHLPASASSHSSASESPDSIGTFFSATYFSLSGITPSGISLSPRVESSIENSCQVL